MEVWKYSLQHRFATPFTCCLFIYINGSKSDMGVWSSFVVFIKSTDFRITAVFLRPNYFRSRNQLNIFYSREESQPPYLLTRIRLCRPSLIDTMDLRLLLIVCSTQTWRKYNERRMDLIYKPKCYPWLFLNLNCVKFSSNSSI